MTAGLGIIQAQNQGQRYRLLEPEDIRLNIDNVTLFLQQFGLLTILDCW